MGLIRLNNQSLTDVTALPFDAGKILQIQQSYVDTTSSQSIPAATATALTALTVDITPSSTNSKIWLFGRLFAEISSTSVANQMVFFYRDTTALRPDTTGLGARPTGLSMVAMGNYGTDAASTPDTTSFFHLDSPQTTSQITYKIGYTHNDGGTLHINKSVTDGNSTGYERGASVIMAMEIAG